MPALPVEADGVEEEGVGEQGSDGRQSWQLYSLGNIFDFCRTNEDPDHAVDAILGDGLGLSVLRSFHEQSERYFVMSDAVLARLGSVEREQILLWLFQVGICAELSDTVVHLTVVLFDRYCATLQGPIPSGRLQLIVVAILSIALKTTGGAEEVQRPMGLRDLLPHLGSTSIQEIFRAEHRILQSLKFEVSMPSPLEFLDAFVAPFQGGLPMSPEGSSPVRCLAKFLLQLSLLEAPLLYRYPHAVLAAGASYVALWCTRAGHAHAAALLAEVAAVAPSTGVAASLRPPDSRCGEEDCQRAALKPHDLVSIC